MLKSLPVRNYKRPTLLRRIERRINIRNLPDLPTYAEFVQQNPDEATALLKDLLISVTNFFRDKKAWSVLEDEVLPMLLKGKKTEEQLRIWVAGCATGEEAYSIAMLCAEKTLGVLDAPKVQIFATDIDEAAIAHAREGLYSLNDAADVSPERLRRFFNKEGDNYRIRREIRETIMFAHHNFIKDPPFSHLDLISCRNVLIYLNHIAQERVAETFHFALKPGGFLFLGSSETVDGATDLYANYNREHHFFQTRHVQTRSYPVPETVPTFRSEQLKIQTLPTEVEKRNSERISYGDLHQRLLEEYAPPSIVIDEEYNAVHISEQAGRYLQISGGEPSQNLLRLVRPELRLELRSALYQSIEQQMPVKARPLQITIGDRVETISIHVRPVLKQDDLARGFILVMFEPAVVGEKQQDVVFTSDESATRHLEEELMRMKVQLRSTIEQYEFQGEELKASNEELQAMNEELRSSAEELETSKEELQSINEELRTVNQELKVKIDETSLSSNILQNLINSTDLGTVFLDRYMRVKMFTPAIGRIFNLIPADHGRPLSDITNKLTFTGIEKDAEEVLSNLQTIEREVRTHDEQTFLMRALPYRTSEDRINGVVLTFFNISERKRAEEQVLESHRRTVEILESINDAFYAVDANFNFTYINKKAEEWWGRKREDLIGKHYWTEFPTAVGSESYQMHHKAMQEGIAQHYDTLLPLINQWIEVHIFPDRMGGLSVYFRNISERKEVEDNLRKSEEQKSFLLKLSDSLRPLSNPAAIQDVATRTIMDYFKSDRCYYCEIDGDTVVIRRDAHQNNLPSVATTYSLSNMPVFRAMLRSDHPIAVNDSKTTEVMDENLRKLCVDASILAYINIPVIKDKQLVGAFCITQSTPRVWTSFEVKLAEETAERIWVAVERVRTEEALKKSEERLQAILNSATDYAIITTDTEGLVEAWSPGAEKIFGYTAAEMIGQSADIIFTPEDRAQGVPQQERRTAREEGRAADERWHLRKDGSRFYVSGVLTPIQDGALTGFVKVARDMTERQQGEEALRIAEERYRTALESAEMAAWDWNIVEDTIVWNKEHFTMLGTEPTDQPLKSDFFFSFLHPEDAERVRNALFEAVTTTGIYQLEFRIVRRDNGEIRWVNGFGRVAEVQNNQASRMVGVMSDINERKAMERQKDDFIGIASHELKTPVTSIKAYAQILEDIFEHSADKEKTRLMQKLDAQVDRLTNLIQDLLDTTKIAEGQLQLHLEDFDTSQLISDNIEEWQRLSAKHQIVWNPGSDCIVHADKERVGQVLTNYISNAIKYSPNGGKVTIQCDRDESNIKVSVTDEGIGIPEDVQRKVFDRFFRVKNLQVKTFPGMGLGLYISAGIIHRLGGDVWVTSVLGKGSTFGFTLPALTNK